MSYNSLLGLGSHSVDANLEADWPSQESTGLTVSDRSGNARNATFSGEATNLNTTTGPNGWLTSAISGDGSDDLVTFPTTAIPFSGAAARTILFFAKAGNLGEGIIHASGNDTLVASDGRAFNLQRRNTNAFGWQYRGGAFGLGTDSWADDTWYHFAIRIPDTPTDTEDATLFQDGVDGSATTIAGVATTISTLVVDSTFLGGDADGIEYTAVDMCGVNHFSRALTDAEVLEIASGPEPENTAAPTVSGDTAQGSTLTCSPGTWALPSPYASGSNGTVTYQYQWTRDGGDISGATSSTYVTQAADVGTAVGCKVLGVNDGGSDAAEQTASSNTISVVAAGSTYRMNMQLFIPT